MSSRIIRRRDRILCSLFGSHCAAKLWNRWSGDHHKGMPPPHWTAYPAPMPTDSLALLRKPRQTESNSSLQRHGSPINLGNSTQ
ncbi:hypothetical protein PpBr36_01068 [Pyricularia pennisetigena]|uniref:hypothetical protein n=1 Tax=Pyricularia pennisetigena TaxID=1578925 RepID=UPI00114F9596|nr:hypothetical protein PpBr36_01068 [Pyricularia pennisetigena]TLS28674.1 hypothetical protein PpBr36_01068 [Pyricularia pennisetigena]